MYTRVRPELFTSGLVISPELADELQSFPAPLDPRVQELIRTTYGSGQSAYDLALSDRLDTMLARTKLQRDQYGIGDCCLVLLDGT